MAQALGDAGLRALPYHSDLSDEYRSRVQQQWSKGIVHIIVATIAFGMGINKVFISHVIHVNGKMYICIYVRMCIYIYICMYAYV